MSIYRKQHKRCIVIAIFRFALINDLFCILSSYTSVLCVKLNNMLYRVFETRYVYSVAQPDLKRRLEKCKARKLCCNTLYSLRLHLFVIRAVIYSCNFIIFFEIICSLTISIFFYFLTNYLIQIKNSSKFSQIYKLHHYNLSRGIGNILSHSFFFCNFLYNFLQFALVFYNREREFVSQIQMKVRLRRRRHVRRTFPGEFSRDEISDRPAKTLDLPVIDLLRYVNAH